MIETQLSNKMNKYVRYVLVSTNVLIGIAITIVYGVISYMDHVNLYGVKSLALSDGVEVGRCIGHILIRAIFVYAISYFLARKSFLKRSFIYIGIMLALFLYNLDNDNMDNAHSVETFDKPQELRRLDSYHERIAEKTNLQKEFSKMRDELGQVIDAEVCKKICSVNTIEGTKIITQIRTKLSQISSLIDQNIACNEQFLAIAIENKKFEDKELTELSDQMISKVKRETDIFQNYADLYRTFDKMCALLIANIGRFNIENDIIQFEDAEVLAEFGILEENIARIIEESEKLA